MSNKTCLVKYRARNADRLKMYSVWFGMVSRCHNSHDSKYPYYGGRGITVCHRWRGSFEAFRSDMGDRPSPHHTVERLDNDGPYCKENCEWATRKVQARNRRSSHLLEVAGVKRTLAEWAEVTGIAANTLWYRVAVSKWTPEEAITVPVSRSNTHRKRASNGH